MTAILRHFGNLSIKYKLGAILAPALVALLCFNTASIVGEIKDVRTIAHVGELTVLALEVNELADAIQKERDASGIYLSSAGTKYESEMNAQRNVTDATIKKFKDFLANFKDQDLEPTIKLAIERLGKFEDERVEISTLSRPFNDAMIFYSTTDILFLNIIGEIPTLLEDGELAYHFNGFYSMLMFKEPMGVERAILSGAFTSNKFARGTYRNLIECVKSQENFKNIYLTAMPKDDRDVLLDVLKDPSTAKSEQFRELAIAKVDEGHFDVNPAEWVKVQTEKMELVDKKLITGHLKTEIGKVTGTKSREAKTALIFTLVVSLGVLTMTLIVAVSIARSILKSVKDAGYVMGEIAKGDFTQEVPVVSEDEMGVLGGNVNTMVADLRKMFVEIGQNSKTLAASAEEMSAISSQLASGSEEMNAQASGVASATEQLSANINAMAAGAEESSANSSTVASTAEQMSANMSSIASAIEEMSITIKDIAGNSEQTSKVANDAMGLSKSASETMQTLGGAANEIGKVTEMIKRIAEQTNLLALNATIEAASAGEAGRGFAVVANEIKQLANQSAQAAEEIAAKIEGVQHSSNGAVRVIDDIAKIIGKIHGAVGVITNVVNQQMVAANEISKNVSEVTAGANSIASSIAEVAKGAGETARNAGEAARGTNEISSNIQGISKAVGDNNSGIQQINASSGELAKIAGGLESMIGRFKVETNNGGPKEISLHKEDWA